MIAEQRHDAPRPRLGAGSSSSSTEAGAIASPKASTIDAVSGSSALVRSRPTSPGGAGRRAEGAKRAADDVGDVGPVSASESARLCSRRTPSCRSWRRSARVEAPRRACSRFRFRDDSTKAWGPGRAGPGARMAAIDLLGQHVGAVDGRRDAPAMTAAAFWSSVERSNARKLSLGGRVRRRVRIESAGAQSAPFLASGSPLAGGAPSVGEALTSPQPGRGGPDCAPAGRVSAAAARGVDDPSGRRWFRGQKGRGAQSDSRIVVRENRFGTAPAARPSS